MTDLAEVAYRAFCDARAGRHVSDAEFEAVKSRVELEWMRAVVAAIQASQSRETDRG